MSGLNQQFTKLSSQKWFREFESHILRMTIKDSITHFIEIKMQAALALSKKNKKDLLNCIDEVWTEKEGTRFIIPGIDQELFIEFTEDKEDYDRSAHVLHVGIGAMRGAKTDEELALSFIHFMQVIHFTVSDIFDPTYSSKDDSEQERIKYACDEGVLKAFSREYAYRYTKEYPGEKFDVEKLFDMAIKIYDEGMMHRNARIYYLDYSSPEKIGFASFRNELHNAHEKALEMTKVQIDEWTQ